MTTSKILTQKKKKNNVSKKVNTYGYNYQNLVIMKIYWNMIYIVTKFFIEFVFEP